MRLFVFVDYSLLFAVCVQLAKDPNHKDVQGREFGILIFSIDIAASLGPQLKQRKFQCVIVDESHMIKVR